MFEKSDKNIVLSFSLLMRLFEWCHEDAKDDVQMHKAMEKIVAFSDGKTPLTIDCYESIINGLETKNKEDEDKKEEPVEIGYANDKDIFDANNLGKCLANAGIDVSNVDYSDIAPVIIQARDNESLNGYGASNAEIENFWKGYETKPLKQGGFTEIDMTPYTRQEPTTMSFKTEDCCELPQCCGEECIDDDLMNQINQVINASKL